MTVRAHECSSRAENTTMPQIKRKRDNPHPSSPPLVRVLRIAHQSLHSHCLQSMSKDSSCLSVCVCLCVCVLETCFLGLLFLNLSFVLLSSPGACAVAAPALPSSLDSPVWRQRCPCNGADGEGSSPLLELTPSPAFKAAPTRVMQGHQTASSLSAWLLLSLALCLSPFPSLPPSLPPVSFSLSVLH